MFVRKSETVYFDLSFFVFQDYSLIFMWFFVEAKELHPYWIETPSDTVALVAVFSVVHAGDLCGR